MHSVIKSTFYFVFIIIALFTSITMLTNAKGDRRISIFGLIVLFLGIGEAFHLVPRIIEIFTGNTENLQPYIDYGRVISSISIIFVYLFLFWFWKIYYKVSSPKNVDVALITLGVIGIVLSVILKSTDYTYMILIRNLPTIVIGTIIVYYFKRSSLSITKDSFRHLWLAVSLGLVFTTGFELFSSSYSFLIILMMPKTLVYIWLVLMGYLGYKKNIL